MGRCKPRMAGNRQPGTRLVRAWNPSTFNLKNIVGWNKEVEWMPCSQDERTKKGKYNQIEKKKSMIILLSKHSHDLQAAAKIKLLKTTGNAQHSAAKSLNFRGWVRCKNYQPTNHLRISTKEHDGEHLKLASLVSTAKGENFERITVQIVLIDGLRSGSNDPSFVSVGRSLLAALSACVQVGHGVTCSGKVCMRVVRVCVGIDPDSRFFKNFLSENDYLVTRLVRLYEVRSFAHVEPSTRASSHHCWKLGAPAHHQWQILWARVSFVWKSNRSNIRPILQGDDTLTSSLCTRTISFQTYIPAWKEFRVWLKRFLTVTNMLGFCF